MPLGCIRKLPTPPDSGPFHAVPRHFSLKYVSIPAKKCLAQRKKSSLPVTLGVFRYTLICLALGWVRNSTIWFFHSLLHLSQSTKLTVIISYWLSYKADFYLLSSTNSTMSLILRPRQMQIFLMTSIDTSSPFRSFVMELADTPDALWKSACPHA